MIFVTAWNNGKHYPTGAGYGVKITVEDREQYFRRQWKLVFIHLEGQAEPIEVNVAKASFWGDTCRELISVEVGRWLIENGLAPWPSGKPPQLRLEPMESAGHFRLHKSLCG